MIRVLLTLQRIVYFEQKLTSQFIRSATEENDETTGPSCSPGRPDRAEARQALQERQVEAEEAGERSGEWLVQLYRSCGVIVYQQDQLTKFRHAGLCSFPFS